MLDAPNGADFARLMGLYLACIAFGFALKALSRRFLPPPAETMRKGPGIARKFKVFFLFQVLMLSFSFWSMPALGLFFLLLFVSAAYEVWALRRQIDQPGVRFEPSAAFGILALFLASLASFHLFALSAGSPWSDGFPFLAFIFLLVAVGDAFSQITGQILRGPKIVPRLSPGKTWSGFLGGLFFTAAIAVAGNALFRFLPYAEAAALGLAIGFLAFLGDITASWVKRRMGLKDFSNLLGPQGGVLDRGDSLLWLGPALWLLPWLPGFRPSPVNF